jgi:hypothetical protein
LRLPFIQGSLDDQVHKAPLDGDGSAGEIELCTFDSIDSLTITGWAWLPDRKRRADLVVIGCSDSKNNFKPVSILRPGGHRNDLQRRFQIPKIDQAGFSRVIKTSNLLPGIITIQGWAIDSIGQKAWPLAGALTPPRP